MGEMPSKSVRDSLAFHGFDQPKIFTHGRASWWMSGNSARSMRIIETFSNGVAIYRVTAGDDVEYLGQIEDWSEGWELAELLAVANCLS